MRDKNVIGYITKDGLLPQFDDQEVLLENPQALQRAIALSGAKPVPLGEVPPGFLKNARVTARLTHPKVIKSFTDGDFIAYYLPQEDFSDPSISPYLLIEQKTFFWSCGGEKFIKLFSHCCETGAEDAEEK